MLLLRSKTKITLMQIILSRYAKNFVAVQRSFEERVEPLLRFLSNPWKIWEKGSINIRRVILKLAFADRIAYDRFEGVSTPELSFPFKALGTFAGCCMEDGGRPWNRTKRASPRGSYSPLPHLAACRPSTHYVVD